MCGGRKRKVTYHLPLWRCYLVPVLPFPIDSIAGSCHWSLTVAASFLLTFAPNRLLVLVLFTCTGHEKQRKLECALTLYVDRVRTLADLSHALNEIYRAVSRCCSKHKVECFDCNMLGKVLSQNYDALLRSPSSSFAMICFLVSENQPRYARHSKFHSYRQLFRVFYVVPELVADFLFDELQASEVQLNNIMYLLSKTVACCNSDDFDKETLEGIVAALHAAEKRGKVLNADFVEETKT